MELQQKETCVMQAPMHVKQALSQCATQHKLHEACSAAAAPHNMLDPRRDSMLCA